MHSIQTVECIASFLLALLFDSCLSFHSTHCNPIHPPSACQVQGHSRRIFLVHHCVQSFPGFQTGRSRLSSWPRSGFKPQNQIQTRPRDEIEPKLAHVPGRGRLGPVLVCDTPKPPGFGRQWVWGAWRQWRPLFLCLLLFHQTISAFERQISKTGHYTNIVCCEVKILHSEQHPGRGEGGNTATLKTFFPAKTRKRYHHIHTSVPPNPQTHIPPGGMHVVVVGHAQAGNPARGRTPPPPPPTSRGSVDTTKTRSGPQRVRMSSGERPIGADTIRYRGLVPPPPPSTPSHTPGVFSSRQVAGCSFWPCR